MQSRLKVLGFRDLSGRQGYFGEEDLLKYFRFKAAHPLGDIGVVDVIVDKGI